MSERLTAHEDNIQIETELLRQAVEIATKNPGSAAVQAETIVETATSNKPYGYMDSNLHGSDDWANFN